MEYLEKIRKITAIFLADELDYTQLQKACQEYKTLLLQFSAIDLDNENNRTDIHFENGKAIGTTWAAACVDDLMRTRKFVRGIFQAVEQLLKEKTKPIQILYAGTGPFATLIVPLLTAYSPEEIQFTLLEINANSMEDLKRVIEKLDAQAYVNNIICENAITYQIADENQPDLLISETMLHALIKEQQVPIMLNLAAQIKPETLIIPASINLNVVWMNSQVIYAESTEKQEKTRTIAPLLQFNLKNMQAYIAQNKAINDYQIQQTVPLSDDIPKAFNQLAISTTIQIFEEEYLNFNESGLTIPYILANREDVEDSTAIQLQYELMPSPNWKIIY